MAFVTISVQPKDRSINSTILPFMLHFSQSSSDTLNVICQVEVWNGASFTPPSQWVTVGGKMRCASQLNNAGFYYINLEDICNPLTDAHLFSQQGLQNCYRYGDGFLDGTFTDWEYMGNRLVRVKVQREYLDATTGLIVVDSDITTSNNFTVHEGAQPNDYNFLGMVNLWDIYYLGYNSSYPDRAMKYYLTNAPRYSIPRPDMTGYPATGGSWEYRYTLKTDENLLLCMFNWKYFDGQKNKVYVDTYRKDGVLLQMREYEITNDNDGMHSYMAGPFSFFLRNTPIAVEGNVAGQEFANVDYYTLQMGSEKSAGGAVKMDIVAPVKVTIDRTCKGDGYQKFAWRNQQGGWDMFSSDGTYQERSSTKRDIFQKRIPTVGAGNNEGIGSLWSYGKNNWTNTTSRVGQIVSHQLTQRQAKWFANIGSSAQVYVSVFNKDNPVPDHTDMEIHEDNFDCQFWLPIIIKSKAIKFIKSKDKTVQIEFTFEYSVNERWGRM